MKERVEERERKTVAVEAQIKKYWPTKFNRTKQNRVEGPFIESVKHYERKLSV